MKKTFTGLFIPEEGKPPIWELLTDYYLHHKPACQYFRRIKLLTQWWDTSVLKCLPYALNEVTKACTEIVQVQNSIEEMIDVYYDYHRYLKLSIIQIKRLLGLCLKLLFIDLMNCRCFLKFTHIKLVILSEILCHILQRTLVRSRYGFDQAEEGKKLAINI